MRDMAGRYWRFPAFQTPAELLGCLCRQMPPILLAAYFSVEAIGLYWLANRVLERPTLLFGIDMSRVFMQQIAERRDGEGNVLSLFIKVTLFMAALALPPFRRLSCSARKCLRSSSVPSGITPANTPAGWRFSPSPTSSPCRPAP